MPEGALGTAQRDPRGRLAVRSGWRPVLSVPLGRVLGTSKAGVASSLFLWNLRSQFPDPPLHLLLISPAWPAAVIAAPCTARLPQDAPASAARSPAPGRPDVGWAAEERAVSGMPVRNGRS